MNNKLTGLAILSVQAGRPIARVKGYIIDPRRLAIVALYVDSATSPQPLVLHTSDIREYNNRGLLIDHDDILMETEGLVRLQEIIDFNFVLMDKLVETEDGQRLGKVGSFAFDTLSWMVVRLNIGQSVVKNMNASQLVVHRQQIVKVTNDRIIVDSTKIKVKDKFSWRRLFLGQKPALNADSIAPED